MASARKWWAPLGIVTLVCLLLTGFTTSGVATAQTRITSPEQFFGFQLGADRKIARWDKIVDYYGVLEKDAGGKLKVVNMGKSTMGNPFLLVIITSPANMAKLEHLREVNNKLSDPRGIPEAEIKKLVGEGKAVICQTMSLHATEIGGTQMAPELAYDLVSRQDEETRRILDNVVFLMVPSFNPDGQIMVTDWYQKTLGTEFEGSAPPWLYHKYAGHDNNRDAFMFNLVESQYLAKIMFQDWSVPQAYVDHHHMGSYSARIYLPPYAEPVRPFADPLIWREHSWYGAHMAYKEEEEAKSGILNAAEYSGWGHFGFHWITPFHNIAGMLTESASAKLATPIFIQPSQLEGDARAFPVYEAQTTFPDPWPGGWWRLRDIVERQKISAWATLDLAARNRETVLWNAYLKAKRQTERGAEGKPGVFVIPAGQHDPLTADKLVAKLVQQGVEVMQSPKAFAGTNGVAYGPGSFVVSLAQPKMGLIRYLLGRTFYPDNTYTRNADGTPIRPYDMSTDTMAEFMGVRVDPLDEAVKTDLLKVKPVQHVGTVAKVATAGFVLDGRLNDSFAAANMLLDKGVALRRVDKSAGVLKPGDFLVAANAPAAVVADVAGKTGVDFVALAADAKPAAHDVVRKRVAVYQRYNGGNADEGWTRLLLEQFDFPYASILAADVAKGTLRDRFDVIVFPDDWVQALTGERGAGPGGMMRPREAEMPEYKSYLAKEHIDALKAFVKQGGTLVALGGSTTFVTDKFELPVRNALAGVSTKEFWCPGSTLHATFDTSHPLAYGMPAEGLVIFLQGNPGFEITPSDHNEWYETVVTYPERDLLQSGWLVGEKQLAKKAAVVSAKFGDGTVVLLGVRAQHRAQAHGTFKLLFNALMR
jgi:hypothetical protein